MPQVYAIWDRKSSFYRFPHFTRDEGSALRSFETAAMDEKTEVGKYPDDFDLARIGDFDENTGVLTPVTPVTVVNAGELLRARYREEMKKRSVENEKLPG